MTDQTIPTFEQLQGSVLYYQYEANPFATAHGLTVSDITATSSDVGNVSIANQSVSAGLWEAELTALSTGSSTITLTVTFSGSTITRVRKFKVTVTNP